MPKAIEVKELKNLERVELLKSVRLGRVHPIRFERPIIHRRGPRHDDYEVSALEGRAMSKDEVTGTLPERIVYKELLARHVPFDFQSSFFGGRLELGGVVADFVILDRPLVIRVQGEYWHSPLPTQRRDDVQKGILEGLGYAVEDLWDYEIYNIDVFNDRLDRILTFLPTLGGGLMTEQPIMVANLKELGDLEERVDRLESALFRGQMSQQIMISARSIQVAELSAIAANLGTITAGNISGATITVTGGTPTAPYLKFTDPDTDDYGVIYQYNAGTDGIIRIGQYDDSEEAEVAQLYLSAGADPYAVLSVPDSYIDIRDASINISSGGVVNVVGNLQTSDDILLKEGTEADYSKLTFSTGSGLQVVAYDGDNTREAARLELLPSAQGSFVAYTYGLGNFISASDQYRAQFGSLYWIKADQQIALGVSSPASAERLFTSGAIKATLTVDAVGGFKDNGTPGVDGSFVDNNGNTVTVSGGIITNLGV